ncbi:MAG: class I SAM-dependent methyltransferase [Fibrobacter sp.]|nr:class I SAM-dependent methyltransferase [Fibrobacter sp.]
MASSTKKDPNDKSYVRAMFDEISSRYDFLNHSLSCFQDILWRRACCKEIRRELAKDAVRREGNCCDGKRRDRERRDGKRRDRERRGRLLDLCGGTGDFAVTYEKFNGPQERAVLGDFSYGMLKGAEGKKTSAAPVQLDAMKMPFGEATFDVVLNGFGMRNVPDAAGALRESARVLDVGGYLQILEFFSPRNAFNKFFYKVLAPLFIPVMGAFFSKRDAYEYLVNSVLNFLSVEDFVKLAEENGFELVHVKPCFWGVAYRVLLKKRAV